VAEAQGRGHEVNYAEALYRARRELRRDPQFGLPYQWAPLVLIGPAE
jgi:CHAT domain-containing protein